MYQFVNLITQKFTKMPTSFAVIIALKPFPKILTKPLIQITSNILYWFQKEWFQPAYSKIYKKVKNFIPKPSLHSFFTTGYLQNRIMKCSLRQNFDINAF